MPARSDGSKEARVPGVDADHWWCKLANVKLESWAKARDLRLPGWRDLTKAAMAHAPAATEDRVRRCVLGTHVMWDVALAVSKVLEIEPPGFYAVFATRTEAISFINDSEAVETITGVADPEALIQQLRRLIRHPAPVESGDDEQRRRPGKRRPATAG